MSADYEETPTITITFQTVLNKNLLRVTDALYVGDLWAAYEALKITIGLLKQEHRNPIMQNELTHLAQELDKTKWSSFAFFGPTNSLRTKACTFLPALFRAQSRLQYFSMFKRMYA